MSELEDIWVRTPEQRHEDEATKGRDYHNEIRAERDALRAEVERLTRERDDAIARQQTAEVYVKDRFIAAGVYNLRVREKMAEDRAEAAEDVARVQLANATEWQLRSEAAERRAIKAEENEAVTKTFLETCTKQRDAAVQKLAMAVEALTLLADLHDAAGMPNCAAQKKARTTIAALKKKDE